MKISSPRLDIILQWHRGNSVSIATNWTEDDAFGINTGETTIKHVISPSYIHILTYCCYDQGHSHVQYLYFVMTGCICCFKHLLSSSAEEHNVVNTEGFGESYPSPRHRSMPYNPVDNSVVWERLFWTGPLSWTRYAFECFCGGQSDFDPNWDNNYYNECSKGNDITSIV